MRAESIPVECNPDLEALAVVGRDLAIDVEDEPTVPALVVDEHVAYDDPSVRAA